MKHDPRALEAALSDLQRQNLKRARATVAAVGEPDSRLVTAGGRQLVDFSSNDYLALARHPEVTTALCDAAHRWGVGSGAAHLVSGHGAEHALLEEELAEFTGRERALLFSTGYMANLAVISALSGPGDWVVLDRLSHASLIDGALLSGARFKRYAHGDADSAARALHAAGEKATIVATDGVFSMDGDIAPLPALAQLSRGHGAWLVVDDAHGLGVLGSSGRGSLEHFGLGPDQAPVLMGTLGKAFGTFGAFVAGSAALIEFLLQTARPYIYTTALPPAVAAATRAALRLAQRESWRRERVLALTQRFRRAAMQIGLQLDHSNTAIQPVRLGSPAAALQAQQGLLEAGFWVVAIRPPTVPKGTARLRVTLSAAHTESQVDALLEALGRVCAAAPTEAA